MSPSPCLDTVSCLHRFRWVYCQLEALRHCLPSSVARILEELPETLDETYERILREINKANREQARHLLQCLTVALRPLRVEELAEILAIELNAPSHGGIPQLNPNWRWADHHQAVLSTCSSLIAIVGDGDSKVVQFSHYSVKEYLTSDRLARSSWDVSRYHIVLVHAHTTFAQACLGVLLRLDDGANEDNVGDIPLVKYAAKYWFDHVGFEKVASRIRDAMEYFFDADKPHWEAWCRVQMIDEGWFLLLQEPSPLYYASLGGFLDLAEHLVGKHPEHINERGGRMWTPLAAALDGKHFEVAELLYRNGADVGVRVSEHVTDTPLHVAAESGRCDIVRWLLDRGADVNAPEKNLRTPLHLAAEQGMLAVAHLLLERDAEVDARDDMERTPLHFASQQGHLGLVSLLLEHHADVFAPNHEGRTFLDVAWERGHKEIVDVNARYEDRQTALHIASQHGDPDLMRWIIDNKADLDAEDEDQETPLFPASRNGRVEATRLLLDADADANHRDWQGMTPLHGASENGHDAVTRLLLKHNAEVNAEHVYHWTPLHLASRAGKGSVAEVLLDGGAEVDAKNDSSWTPLHMASQKGHLDIVKLLLARHADVDARKADEETPLHLAAFYGNHAVAQVLLNNGADPRLENKKGETPFDLASREHHDDIVQLLKDMALVEN